MKKALNEKGTAQALDELRKALGNLEAAVNALPTQPLPESVRPNPPEEWR